jgi:murein DD-endopeptidase MepM/ murein hydrolase activator NlpD
MNPRTALTLWSFRKELWYVILAFMIILSTPIIAVFILVNTGINTVSDALVHLNPTTKTIELFTPTGSKYKDLQLTTSWPVTGVITLEFGESDLPYQPFHIGIDIANPQGHIGDNIVPLMPGTVIYAGETTWGYGKHIIIDNGNNITTVYAHLDKIFVVKGRRYNHRPGRSNRLGHRPTSAF